MFEALWELLRDLGKLFFGITKRSDDQPLPPIGPPPIDPPPPPIQPSPLPPPPPPVKPTWPHGPQADWWLGTFKITQGYGCTDFAEEGHNPNHPECAYFHEGIDFGMPCGTPIYAATDVYIRAIDPPGYGPEGDSAALDLFDGNADIWMYHMHDYAVQVGHSYTRGTLLGHSGTRGYSTGCHLHFEVRPNHAPYRGSINPTGWLHRP